MKTIIAVFLTAMLAFAGLMILALHDVALWKALPLVVYIVWAQVYLSTRHIHRSAK